jgi:hypothetical protein
MDLSSAGLEVKQNEEIGAVRCLASVEELPGGRLLPLRIVQSLAYSDTGNRLPEQS